MINIGIIGAVNLSSPPTGNAKLPPIQLQTRCIVKLLGRELFRTEIASTESPTWNATFQLATSQLSIRCRDNMR